MLVDGDALVGQRVNQGGLRSEGWVKKVAKGQAFPFCDQPDHFWVSTEVEVWGFGKGDPLNRLLVYHIGTWRLFHGFAWPWASRRVGTSYPRSLLKLGQTQQRQAGRARDAILPTVNGGKCHPKAIGELDLGQAKFFPQFSNSFPDVPLVHLSDLGFV
jgi:hypothetical protein